MEKKGFPEEVRREVAEAQNYMCRLCDSRLCDFHHRLSNNSSNRKLFPLFLNSVFNCVGLCRACHDSARIYELAISLKEAALYEHYLRDLRDNEGRGYISLLPEGGEEG